jgi:membrane-bound lytic murein transglycosylase B
MSRFLPRGVLVWPLFVALASCAGAASPAGHATVPASATAPAGSAATGSASATSGAPSGAASFDPTPGAPAASADFKTWLAGFKAEALGKGISQASLDAAFADVAPIPRVIELDRKQPEVTMTFAQYQAKVVNEARVRRGRALLAENRAVLDRVSARTGVPPQVIVALWGIESDFGRLTGGFNVFASLATLAYDGRRSAFFRGELMKALQILEENHLPADRMTGSWAGAMGQCQFMPSSFLKYAADGDGDGRRDIWTSKADVFASAANYLATVGWQAGETWGWPVRTPERFDAKLASPDVRKTAAEWARLGVRPLRDRAVPASSSSAAVPLLQLVLPEGPGGAAYLVGENYRAIMRWNRSTYFAVAVGSLSDRIVAE